MSVGIGISSENIKYINPMDDFIEKECDKWRKDKYCFSTSIKRTRVYCGESPCSCMPPWADKVKVYSYE